MRLIYGVFILDEQDNVDGQEFHEGISAERNAEAESELKRCLK